MNKYVVAILTILLVSGGALYLYGASIPTPRNTLEQSSDNDSTSTPSIRVVDWKSDGPATITVEYRNLPARTSALALCADTDVCTEWVEEFHPSSSSGTYTMSVQHQYPDSQKGMGSGKFRVVVIGTEFVDQIVSSDVFTVNE